MSEPIKVGDLVMVVKPKTCCSEALGYFFKVEEIKPSFYFAKHTEWRCPSCGAAGKFIPVAGGGFAYGHPGFPKGISLHRLKRIDPPCDEMKREVTKELENV